MSIKVLYFASLREEVGRSNETFDLPTEILTTLNIEQLWKQLTGQQTFPENLLVAVNQEYTDKQEIVSDGDEVAFFPPVTGG